jgi:hypothetical protein
MVRPERFELPTFWFVAVKPRPARDGSLKKRTVRAGTALKKPRAEFLTVLPPRAAFQRYLLENMMMLYTYVGLFP